MGMSTLKKEYAGREFEILLHDSGFSLVDTTPVGQKYGPYSDVWIWHLCDDYMDTRKPTDFAEGVGLLSNQELYSEKCNYCQLRIPQGMIAAWKMMNWHNGEYSDYTAPA